MKHIISPNPKQTQLFAENVCNDFNMIHSQDYSKQIVPGDWAVTQYLKQYNASIGSVNFEFKDMIFPSEQLLIEKDGIYKHDNLEKPVMKVSSDENFQLNENMLRLLQSNYCLSSGDINKNISELLKKVGFKIDEQKSKIIYTSSQIFLNDNIQKTKDLERRIGNTDVSNLRLKGKTGGGKVIFSFPLIGSDQNQVGLIKKTIACLRLSQLEYFNF